MFSMNPAAKEFVPAHILKKRQEEAERLGEQLDKIDIKSEEGKQNGETSCSNKDSAEQKVQAKTSNSNETVVDENIPKYEEPRSTNSNSSNNPLINQNNHTTQQQQCGAQTNGLHHNNNNNHCDGDYPEGLQELIDQEDDRFLLNAGENLCEFNGEQFIIPGDDDYESTRQAGYDFGNVEDNEDEDVCNAFEKFLGNLPSE